MDRHGQTRRILLNAAISVSSASTLRTALASHATPTSSTSAPTANHIKSLPSPADDKPDIGQEKLYISGARQSEEQYMAVVFTERGNIVTSLRLSARAHGAASHQKTHRACLFARRPGMYINTFDTRYPQKHDIVSPVSGRYFYGHGTYSLDGSQLFATENDFDGMRGVIGIYDANNAYQRLDELQTAGIGPHEIVRVPDTSLLVVANGGIHTHPDTGRDKLNIDSMHPSLSIIDSRNGKLLGQHFLPDESHQVSLRHLACSDDGEVWFAGQYEGLDPIAGGLAGVVNIAQSISSFQRGSSRQGLSMIELPAGLQMQSKKYLSSVAVVGEQVVYTSSRGALAFKVDRATRQLASSVSVFDGSGVASLQSPLPPYSEHDLSGSSALLTTGTGEILRLDGDGITPLATHPLQWDNHVYRL